MFYDGQSYRTRSKARWDLKTRHFNGTRFYEIARVYNPLGFPMDGKSYFNKTEQLKMFPLSFKTKIEPFLVIEFFPQSALLYP